MTATERATASTRRRSLRNLYLVRFVVAIIWVAIMLATQAGAVTPSPLLTVLLVLYPLFDGGRCSGRCAPIPRRIVGPSPNGSTSR